MDAVINLFLPENEQLPPRRNHIRETKDDIGNPLFILNGKTYVSYVDAKVAQVAEDILTFDQPDDLDIMQYNLQLILNPPYHYIPKVDDAFDIDFCDADHLPHDEEIALTHNSYYVESAMYDQSCPHNNAHHKRYYNNGLISCNLSRLAAYSKIMTWYKEQKDNFPFKDAPPMVNDEVINPGDETIKHIIQKVLQDTNPNPVSTLERYITGLQYELDINTLNKHALTYDYKRQMWFKDIDVDNYIPENNDNRQTMDKLEALNNIKSSIDNNRQIDIDNIIIISNHDFTANILIRDSQFISTVDSYFKGLHQYRTSVFDFINHKWIVINNHTFHLFPTLYNTIFNDNRLHPFLDTFMKIINSINDINGVAN